MVHKDPVIVSEDGKGAAAEPRGAVSPATECATEMRSYLGNADTLGQKPRRTQCTVKISGELK